MSTQQQQKSKNKKSYDQLLEEFLTARKRIAVIYIPLLAEALRDEKPNWTYPEVKERLVNDAIQQGWNEQYILRCLPSWLVEDDPQHKRVKKLWETRHANELKRSREKLDLYTKNIPEPPEQKEHDESYEPISDEKLHEIGLGSFGDTGKTIFGIINDIHEGARLCFKALCNDKFIPTSAEEDLLVDYIKPTREYRLSLAMEMKESDRATLHNAMHSLIEAAEDMIQQIEKADKK